MTIVAIDKGVPMPVPKRTNFGNHRGLSYPWEGMEIGDSFLVDFPTARDALKTARTLASRQFRKDGRRYRAARVSKSGELRIWRVDESGKAPLSEEAE